MKLKNIALIMSSILAISGCGGSSGNKSGVPADLVPVNTTVADPTANASAIVYNDIAVHDPSIVRADDGTYYVFGSHLGAAKSTDLMKWTSISSLSANDKVDESPLFNTYSSQIAEGINWTDGYKGSWAPDVIKAPSGKYWFYYNHCAQTEATGGCWNRSYLGLAESASITGPYVNKGILLRSGYRNAGEFTTYPLDNGQKTYDGAVDPNVIDPHAFYDKAGKLWLVYGSYSGGIFILELDSTTGKAKAGQGYGKHIAGGGFAPIEGTWITYSPEADYYYMFNSIAGFDAAGGYNIRVSRSKNPNGPYLDAAGSDMLLAKNDVATLSKYGVKLMGGFNFVSEKGEGSTGWGYLSPGHNSVYYDATAKKYFLVTHTRFPNRGEEHSVRVHELWLNNDGWFVASPQRYAPISGSNVVDANDLTGEYRFISHEKDSNTTGHNSVYIRLNDDRTISGEATGYFRLSDTDNKRITLIIGGKTYEGVMAWQWDESLRKLMPTFSAVSTEGVSVWGSKLVTRTVAQNLTAIADDVTLPAQYVDSTLTVPLRGTRAAKITWNSSNPAIINFKVDKKTGALTGIAHVNRPSATAGDQNVTLTATITEDGQTQTKTIIVKVLALRVGAPSAQFKFDGDLKDAAGNFAAATPTGDRIDNTGGVAAYVSGRDGQAISLNNYGVLLPNGIINSYQYTISYWLKPSAKTLFTSSFFAAVGFDWISLPLETGWDQTFKVWHISSTVGAGDTWCASGVALPLNEWTQVTLSVDKGLGTVYVNGQKKCTASGIVDLFTKNVGTFAVGVNYWDTPYNGLVDDLKIYNSVLTPDEVGLREPGSLPADDVLATAKADLSIGDVSALKSDLDLPLAGTYGTAISWSSNNTAAIDSVGTVTQPAATSPDATATLTATISYGGKSVTKVFSVTVKSKAPPTPTATYSFENNLNETSGVFAAGSPKLGFMNVDGGQVSYADGVVGKALVLDGTSCVRLADNLITDNSYSISIWLNESVAKNYTSAFFGMTNDTHWVSLVPGTLGGGTQSLFWSGSVAWFDGLFGTKIPLNTWTHVIVTVNSGALKAYINGVPVASANGFPDVLTGSTQFAVGCSLWDTPFKGQIDEVKVYNDVLSADDAAIIYTQGTAH